MLTKEEQYLAAFREIQSRMEKGGDLIGDLGNAAAVLKKRLGFYWVGFYFVSGNTLVLGPFQGTPACVFLPFGEGVCGTCAMKKIAVLVPDVSAFPGYIACDPLSKSEIAVPVFDPDGNIQAVLDADSENPDAFDETDKRNLEHVAELLKTCWND